MQQEVRNYFSRPTSVSFYESDIRAVQVGGLLVGGDSLVAHVLHAFGVAPFALNALTADADEATKKRLDQARDRSDNPPAEVDELAEALRVICTIASLLPICGHPCDAAPASRATDYASPAIAAGVPFSGAGASNPIVSASMDATVDASETADAAADLASNYDAERATATAMPGQTHYSKQAPELGSALRQLGLLPGILVPDENESSVEIPRASRFEKSLAEWCEATGSQMPSNGDDLLDWRFDQAAVLGRLRKSLVHLLAQGP